MAAPVIMRIYSEVCGWYCTFLDSQITKEKNESVNAGWELTSEIRMPASLLTQHTSFTFSHQGNCYVTGVQGKRQHDKGGATRGRCPFLSQSLPSFKHRYRGNISNEGPDLLHNPYFRLT